MNQFECILLRIYSLHEGYNVPYQKNVHIFIVHKKEKGE
jgi:hypothetical protein